MPAPDNPCRPWSWRAWVWGMFGVVGWSLWRLVLLIVTGWLLWQNQQVQMWVMVKMLRHQASQPLAEPPVPSLASADVRKLAPQASALRSADELFRPTNVWDVHLRFTSNQWAAVEPKSVPPILGFRRPDGTVILRNPAATRAGLLGVVGFDLPWSEAALEFGDARFQTVGARFKGNGTFLGAVTNYKRPFKLDLHRQVASQQLAGRTTLNFHNLTSDFSCLSDTLAYEFFREAGVPAPRTAFARLRLSVGGRMERRLLGLYVMVENPDGEWAREQFGVAGVALFKPVTYELFADLGNDWPAYEAIYDPKTKTSPVQQRRLIELARLVSHATDEEFGARVGEFIDLTEFARFLACQVILANYDGILTTGQNFLLYQDPRSGRFGFIPWDMDHCWGEFPFTGTAEQRERASLEHPWVGKNRFLERMLGVASFREEYRAELQRLRKTHFVPERLSARLDELATVIRPFVREESAQRLAKFEDAVADRWPDSRREGDPNDPNRQAFPLKRFFAARAVAVTEQLEGRAEGVILNMKLPQ